jgi:hypothetical protein
MASYPSYPPPPPPPDQAPPPPPQWSPPPPGGPSPWQAPTPTGWRAWSAGKKVVVGGAAVVGALVVLGVLNSLANPKPPRVTPPVGGNVPPTASSPGAAATSAPPSASVAVTTASPTVTPDLRPAAFEQSDLTINPSWAALGGDAAVSINVANRGGLSGSYLVELTVDGERVASHEVTLDGGANQAVTFALPALPLGAHVIDVNGDTGEFRVADVQRPDSGTMLINKGRKGEGILEIVNEGTRDAIVAMTRANNPSKTPVAIYVRGGATETIRRIGDGNYVIFYGYGDDWDGYSQRFLTDATYRKFADPFPYETTATTLPGWQLTLQSAVGGSAPTDPVSGGDFPAFEGEEP